MSTALRSSTRVILFGCAVAIALSPAVGQNLKSTHHPVEFGELLFHHNFGLPETWKEPEPLGAGGDGLGPQFNDFSCASCHRNPAVGGAGPVEKNAMIVSFLAGPGQSENALRAALREASRLHPELSDTQVTAALHRFGLPGVKDKRSYEEFLSDVYDKLGFNPDRPEPVHGKVGVATLQLAQRNTTALWGVGLIEEFRQREGDAIRRRQMEEMNRKHPWLSGRVPRNAQQQESWFGWRGQVATLHDFNLNACSTELGLTVPNRSQHQSPVASAQATQHGLDLTAEQTLALTAFVASLPAPEQILPTDPTALERVRLGEEVFNRIHCNACHVRDLGWLRGIFSDLLLHDLGLLCDENGAVPELVEGEVIVTGLSSLSSGGWYGGGSAGSIFQPPRVKPTNWHCEWRTPPLWGVADSAPYLHDGRAATLDEAIRWHGGEAELSRQGYLNLSESDRLLLLEFLGSLRAPQTAPTSSTRPQVTIATSLNQQPGRAPRSRPNAAAQPALTQPDPAQLDPAQPAPAALPAGAEGAARAEVVAEPQPAAVIEPADVFQLPPHEAVEISPAAYDRLAELLERLKPSTANVDRAASMRGQLASELPHPGAADYALALFRKQALQHQGAVDLLTTTARLNGPFAARARQGVVRDLVRRREFSAALTMLEQHATKLASDATLSERDLAEQAEWLGATLAWMRGPGGVNSSRTNPAAALERVRTLLPPQLVPWFEAGIARVDQQAAALQQERIALVGLTAQQQQAQQQNLAEKQSDLAAKQDELSKSRAQWDAWIKEETERFDQQLAELEKQYIERDEREMRMSQVAAPISLRISTLLEFAAQNPRQTSIVNSELGSLNDQLSVITRQREENRTQARVIAVKAQQVLQARQTAVAEYSRKTGQAAKESDFLSKWQDRFSRQSETVSGTAADQTRKVQVLDRKIRDLSTYDRFDVKEEAMQMLARYRPRE